MLLFILLTFSRISFTFEDNGNTTSQSVDFSKTAAVMTKGSLLKTVLKSLEQSTASQSSEQTLQPSTQTTHKQNSFTSTPLIISTTDTADNVRSLKLKSTMHILQLVQSTPAKVKMPIASSFSKMISSTRVKGITSSTAASILTAGLTLSVFTQSSTGQVSIPSVLTTTKSLEMDYIKKTKANGTIFPAFSPTNPQIKRSQNTTTTQATISFTSTLKILPSTSLSNLMEVNSYSQFSTRQLSLFNNGEKFSSKIRNTTAAANQHMFSRKLKKSSFTATTVIPDEKSLSVTKSTGSDVAVNNTRVTDRPGTRMSVILTGTSLKGLPLKASPIGNVSSTGNKFIKPRIFSSSSLTSSLSSVNSTSVTVIATRTNVVTIRTSKSRGLPPWAVITVAVGAFLFVCLIAIAAFKIVQWNKDHGDYKLWSTDLELTPITSRSEKDHLMDSDGYEKPLFRPNEDIRIYSNGRCIAVIKAKSKIGSDETEIHYPLKRERKTSPNNNIPGFAPLINKDRSIDFGQDVLTTSAVSSEREESVFNIELCDRSSENGDSSEFIPLNTDNFCNGDVSLKEPEYYSIDDLGLVKFLPGDLFCQGFDTNKPLPPIPVEKAQDFRENRRRACSLDNSIDCDNSDVSALSNFPRKNSLDFNVHSNKMPAHPLCYWGSLPRKPFPKCTKPSSKCWIPPSPQKYTSGEQKLRHGINDVSHFLSANSHDHLDSIDFTSYRKARSLPRPRRPKKSPEIRLCPVSPQVKKGTSNPDPSSIAHQTVDITSDISANKVERGVSGMTNHSKVKPSRNGNCSSPGILDRRKGSKDFVEVEVGFGRPRLVPKEDERRPSVPSLTSVLRGRTTSSPVMRSKNLKLAENDRCCDYSNSKGRKISLPINIGRRKENTGRGNSVSNSCNTGQNCAVPIDANRVENGIRGHAPNLPPLLPPSPDPELHPRKSPAIRHPMELQESDSLSPYAEVRMSAVFKAREANDCNTSNSSRPAHLLLPYLTINLNDKDNSLSDEEAVTQSEDYLKVVPSLPPRRTARDKNTNFEPLYWNPKMEKCEFASGEVSQPEHDTDIFSSTVMDISKLNCKNRSRDNLYTEIDSIESKSRHNTYESLQSMSHDGRFSIISIPEPGYEAVKKRQSQLIKPSRESVDSAVFSAYEEIHPHTSRNLSVSEDITMPYTSSSSTTSSSLDDLDANRIEKNTVQLNVIEC